MVEVTTADIDRAYDAAIACIPVLMNVTSPASAVSTEHRRSGKAASRARDERVAALETAMSALAESTHALEIEVAPIREMLHLCNNHRIEIQLRFGPSFLETFLVYMQQKADPSGLDLSLQGTELWNQVHNLGNVGNWTDEQFAAELNIERARVKDRVRKETGVPLSDEFGFWRMEGGRVVLLGELGRLRRRSRRLMQYLIQRRARAVTYNDLGTDVWESDVWRKGTIQQAMSKLRADLRALDLDAIEDRIRSEDDGYLFR